jgi:hypothetical protein
MSQLPSDLRVIGTLKDLLGRNVKGSKEKVRLSGNAIFAHYVASSGPSEVLWLWDLPAGVSVAAALSMFPNEQVVTAVRQGKVDAPLMDNFQEVANVLVSLLNEKSEVAFSLKEVGVTDAKKGPMIDKLKTLKDSLGISVSVDGYQSGQTVIAT